MRKERVLKAITDMLVERAPLIFEKSRRKEVAGWRLTKTYRYSKKRKR